MYCNANTGRVSKRRSLQYPSLTFNFGDSFDDLRGDGAVQEVDLGHVRIGIRLTPRLPHVPRENRAHLVAREDAPLATARRETMHRQ